MSYTICSRFKGEHIVYAGYTIYTSREHIVYGAFCGSTVPQLYPLCSPGGSNQGCQTKIPLICFISIIPLPAKPLDRFGKILTIDLFIQNFK